MRVCVGCGESERAFVFVLVVNIRAFLIFFIRNYFIIENFEKKNDGAEGGKTLSLM